MLSRSLSLVFCPMVLATTLLARRAEATPVTLGPLTPIYQGVNYETATVGGSQAYAVSVDLTAPGIGLTTTPPGGTLETVGQTTSQFLTSSGTQVAINANFFAPCCRAAAEPKSLLGLAVSNGTIVSPYAAGENNSVLLLTKTDQAIITTITGPQPGVFNAVSGSSIIVQGGRDIAPPAGNDAFIGPNPRTDVGVSRDGRYLYLAAIDGRQPGYSVGATLQDAADLLIGLGAYTALNLDGGGSTALVQSDGLGGALLLNHPSGNHERYDGNNLGVFALPLAVAVPEPGSLALLMMGVVSLVIGSRRRPRRSVQRWFRIKRNV